jgi:phosphoglycolate phosphatase-like HAD superfamily hydrolase
VSEPTTTGIILWDVLKWLGAAVVGLLTYIGKRHDDRLSKLESEAQSKETADVQRSEMRQELREHRQESNVKFDRVFERLDTVLDRLNGGTGP